MKKYGSRNAKARVAKNTVRKMLNIPFWAYCVQISTTRLLSATEALVVPSSRMFALMNSTARYRSEERRVGKERRCRHGRNHQNIRKRNYLFAPPPLSVVSLLQYVRKRVAQL